MDLLGRSGGLPRMLCVPWYDVFDSSTILEYCTDLGGMPFVFHLCAFISDGLGAPFILGLMVVGPV